MDLLGMMDINFPSLIKTSAVRLSDFTVVSDETTSLSVVLRSHQRRRLASGENTFNVKIYKKKNSTVQSITLGDCGQ